MDDEVDSVVACTSGHLPRRRAKGLAPAGKIDRLPNGLAVDSVPIDVVGWDLPLHRRQQRVEPLLLRKEGDRPVDLVHHERAVTVVAHYVRCRCLWAVGW